MTNKLDEIDKTILKILQADATLPYKYIADVLNKSEATISARVKQLNMTKVILSTRAQLDPSSLGLTSIGCIHLTVDKQTDKAMQELKIILEGIQGLCSCTRIRMNVPANLRVRIAAENTKVFNGISDAIGSIPNVRVTDTYMELDDIIPDKGFYF
jgi:DNA-binding Lrp family transcriptional regulator